MFVLFVGKEVCDAVSRCEGNLTICIMNPKYTGYCVYRHYILNIGAQYRSALFVLHE